MRRPVKEAVEPETSGFWGGKVCLQQEADVSRILNTAEGW